MIKGFSPLKEMEQNGMDFCNKMGSDPGVSFLGCILFFEGPNP